MILDSQLTDERAEAVRTLLAAPLVVRDTDPEVFRLLAVHRDWLTEKFDYWCGWKFRIDLTGGTARLYKRRATVDTTRGAVRPADARPFDQARYVLLMCVCAELVTRPHTTISDLADTLAVVCAADDDLPDFNPADHLHRNAFADVLRWLIDTGLATVTAGAIDQYAGQGRDAVVEADVTRLALLPASTLAPSRIAATDHDGWLDALTREPRYGDVDGDGGAVEQRNLWARHTLVRAVLDDPAVDVADLPARVVEYLSTPTGRQQLDAVVTSAGMALERHADVLLAVDPARQATDGTFGDRASTVAQAAGALLAVLLEADRTPRTCQLDELEAHVAGLLAADPGWARAYQDDRGARRLTTAALHHLTAFALATVDGPTVTARPAAARLAVTVTDERTPTPGPVDATAPAGTSAQDTTTAPETHP